MQLLRTSEPYGTTTQDRASWTQAYWSFLRSKNENMALKVAPLALLGILPIDILSNLIPLVGELDDIGYILALAVIIARTSNRVRKYR
jgi:uncharacterized membrane protein YkvA (DUF1232 family)